MTAPSRDIELLSAYLDGQLPVHDAARLESRLKTDENLRRALSDLRTARGLLRQLPQRAAPRNFRLTPGMLGLKPPMPRAYPVFRLATALATLLFLITFVLNGLTSSAAPRLAAAPAPAIMLGGGNAGSASSEFAPPAPEAPAQPFAAQARPATELPSTAGDNSHLLAAETPTPELAPTPLAAASSNQGNPLGPARLPLAAVPPVSFIWQFMFGILAVLCGAAAAIVRFGSERKFRERWKKK